MAFLQQSANIFNLCVKIRKNIRKSHVAIFCLFSFIDLRLKSSHRKTVKTTIITFGVFSQLFPQKNFSSQRGSNHIKKIPLYCSSDRDISELNYEYMMAKINTRSFIFSSETSTQAIAARYSSVSKQHRHTYTYCLL